MAIFAPNKKSSISLCYCSSPPEGEKQWDMKVFYGSRLVNIQHRSFCLVYKSHHSINVELHMENPKTFFILMFFGENEELRKDINVKRMKKVYFWWLEVPMCIRLFWFFGCLNIHFDDLWNYIGLKGL